MHWNLLPFTGNLPRHDRPPPRPDRLPEMIEAAEQLGQETDFVRVDLYDLPDRLLVGELPSYRGAGDSPFEPACWNLEFGRPWTVRRRYGR